MFLSPLTASYGPPFCGENRRGYANVNRRIFR
nr:MAG TPA: hypothetical protein [Bacteriophage sp.]